MGGGEPCASLSLMLPIRLLQALRAQDDLQAGQAQRAAQGANLGAERARVVMGWVGVVLGLGVLVRLWVG